MSERGVGKPGASERNIWWLILPRYLIDSTQKQNRQNRETDIIQKKRHKQTKRDKTVKQTDNSYPPIHGSLYIHIVHCYRAVAWVVSCLSHFHSCGAQHSEFKALGFSTQVIGWSMDQMSMSLWCPHTIAYETNNNNNNIACNSETAKGHITKIWFISIIQRTFIV